MQTKRRHFLSLVAVGAIAAVGLLASVGVAGAASANTAAPGAITPITPRPANIVVLTPDDNGKTVNVRPGSYVVVALGNDLDWTITSSDPDVLGPLPVTWARNGVAIFRANAAGQATIDGVGRPQCDPGQPCPLYIVNWSARVNVIGIVPLPAS
jgi:hypothetical protein